MPELVRAGEELDRFFASHEVDPRAENGCRVVLEEMVSNIIKYAFEVGETDRIRFLLELDDNEIVVTLEDDGRPFDPFDRPAESEPLDLADAAVGGRGLDFVRMATEERSYRRVGDTNRVELRIARDRDGSSGPAD